VEESIAPVEIVARDVSTEEQLYAFLETRRKSR
jgi:hypothetical protein